MSLFPNYGPLPCSFDWVHKPNRTLTFSTNLIVPPIMCLLMVGHGDFFDGGSLIVISLIFDFELMG